VGGKARVDLMGPEHFAQAIDGTDNGVRRRLS
jgi:hypothetical protein